MTPECPTCDKEFSSAHGVKSHHKQVHDEQLSEVPGADGESECPTCSDVFVSYRAMKVHHAQIHDEKLEPPVGCDWLREHYVEKEWHTTEIAEECNVSATTVKKWLDRCDIEIRDIAEAKADGDIEKVMDEEWLREQYCQQERSTPDIAAECELGCTTVVTWLERHGIEKRTLSEEMAEGEVEKLHDEEWLREQYVDQQKEAYEISEMLGLSNGTTVAWLDRHGIERRDIHEAQADGNITPLRDRDWLETQYWDKERTASEIANDLGVYDSTVNRWLTRHGIERKGQSVARAGEGVRKLEDAKWLRKQYNEKELSTVDIADKCGVTSRCVNDWMQRHGIERRGWEGEDNAMWKGGKDDYYGPSWHSARREVRERDEYMCRRCGMTDEEHINQYGQELHVHHIQPFRTFEDHAEANKVDNLITLCRDCHDKLEGMPIDI